MSTIKNTYPNLLTAAQIEAKAKFTDDDFQIGAVYYVPEFVFTDIDEPKTSYYKLVKREVKAETLVADLAMFAGAIKEGGGGAFDVVAVPTSVLSTPDDTPAALADVVLTATVTDTAGTKSKVEFYEDDEKLGEDAAAPFTHTVVGIAAGEHKYTARTFDTYGNVTISNELTVTAS